MLVSLRAEGAIHFKRFRFLKKTDAQQLVDGQQDRPSGTRSSKFDSLLVAAGTL